MTTLLVILMILLFSLSLAIIGTSAALRLMFRLMTPSMVPNRRGNSSTPQQR